jgi:hypothetical protein
MTGNSETQTAIRPSMPRSDGSPIARNVNCIYIPDVRFVRSSAGAGGRRYTKWTRIPQNLAWGCWLADHRCSLFQLPLVYISPDGRWGATFILRFFPIFPRVEWD